MSFTSLEYYLFLPLVFIVASFITGQIRLLWLLIVSYVAYATFGSPALLVSLTGVTLLTYWCGLKIASGDECSRKWWLRVGITGNILILVVMKYLPFIGENIGYLLSVSGYKGIVGAWPAIISVGVSFYVFQAVGYLLDINLELQEPERNVCNFALSLAFFPKLLQGPIERCNDLLQQFRQPYRFDYDNVRTGMLLFAWGLFKKLVVADRLALFANEVYGNVHHYSGISLLLGTYAYAFQLYFDFSAYTDMARGTARLFNVNLTQNFNSPYLATSVSDFWRRWHISFSRWILDYIFKPLQIRWRYWGNRGTASALLITFLVSGIWHGASWCFIVWGMLHGFYLAGSVFWKPFQKKLYKRLGISKGWLISLWQTAITFHLVCFGWIFFRANTLQDAWYVITHLITFGAGEKYAPKEYLSKVFFLNQSSREVIIISVCLILMVGFSIIRNRTKIVEFGEFAWGRPFWVRWGLYTILCMSLLVFGVFTSSTFIYYRF